MRFWLNHSCNDQTVIITASSSLVARHAISCHTCDTDQSPGTQWSPRHRPVSTDWSLASLCISLSLSSRGCEARPDSAHYNQLPIPQPRSRSLHSTLLTQDTTFRPSHQKNLAHFLDASRLESQQSASKCIFRGKNVISFYSLFFSV